MGALAQRSQVDIELAVFSRSDARPSQFVRHLCAGYPYAFSAKKLMGFCGFTSHRGPLTPFVEFINMVNRINRTIAPLGWKVVRTGGTPDDEYWLSPVAG